MILNVDIFSKFVVIEATHSTIPIKIPDNLGISKNIQISMGYIQKTNENNQLLYKLDKDKETIDKITITKYKDKTIVNKVIDEKGGCHEENSIIQVPVEWVGNEPIMIPNMVDRHVKFLDNPNIFTLEDIITFKYRDILENSNYDYIIAQEFIEQNINTKDEHHTANIGVGFIQLLPKGQAKTESILLDEGVSTLELLLYEGNPEVELYVNDVKIQNNKVTLTSKTNNIIVTFKNPTDKALLINAYALGY